MTATVTYGSRTGRAVVLAAVLGSGMTFLDGTVVNVALRTIGEDLDASLAELQWITNGYLLSLSALILLGGSLGDRFGRRRVFVLGTVVFAAASVLCGLAPTPLLLIVARILQGVGAALLMPGSLAMIQGAFVVEDRGRAIGAWSGLAGISTAIGPFVGGWLIEYASWRWIFLINVPLAAVTIVVAQRSVPETFDPDAPTHFDLSGAALVSVALAGTTYALIEWGSTAALVAAVLGIAGAIGFLLVEDRSSHPMLPLGLFRDRTFSAANAMTLVVYAALGAVTFFVVLQLQTVGGYDALEAGVAMLPITFCMLFLASRFGALGTRIGPRIPMTVGPLVMGGGRADAGPARRGRAVRRGRAAGADRLRARPRGDGRPAHLDGAGRGARRPRRHRQRGQQRGGPRRLAAGGRGAAGGRRPHRVRRTPIRRCSTPATRRRWWSARCCWPWVRRCRGC